MKWKYPEMNSVDFLFEVVFHLVITFTLSVDLLSNLMKFLLNQVDKDGHENMYLNRRGEKMLLEGNSVVFEGLFVLHSTCSFCVLAFIRIFIILRHQYLYRHADVRRSFFK